MMYLVRHGLDDESYIGGHSNIDLTEVGIKQVEDTGIWIKEDNIGFQNSHIMFCVL